MSSNYTNESSSSSSTGLALEVLLSSLPSSWWNRFFLVGSNIGAFLPLAYLWIRVRPFPRDAFWFTVAGFLASFTFHMCDDTDVQGSNCLVSDNILLASDVIIENELVMVAILYPIPRSRADLKALAYTLFLFVNAVLYIYYPEPDDTQMIVWAAIAFVVLLFFHWVIRRNAIEGNLQHFVHNHINWCAGVLFVVFACGGLAMRFVGNAEYGIYTQLHSAWHIAGFASLYFYFRIFDRGGLWTWQEMRCGYDVAAMDDVDSDCDDEDGVHTAVFTGVVAQPTAKV